MSSTISTGSDESLKLIRAFFNKHKVKHVTKDTGDGKEVRFDHTTLPQNDKFMSTMGTLVKKLMKIDDWASTDDVIYIDESVNEGFRYRLKNKLK